MERTSPSGTRRTGGNGEDAVRPERIATNTCDFETMRTTGITYVDKTGILCPIVDRSMGKLHQRNSGTGAQP